MRKLMEQMDSLAFTGLTEREFDQFREQLTSIGSVREQLRTLYLWSVAENGLTEDDFLDLAEYVVEFGDRDYG